MHKESSFLLIKNRKHKIPLCESYPLGRDSPRFNWDWVHQRNKQKIKKVIQDLKNSIMFKHENKIK